MSISNNWKQPRRCRLVIRLALLIFRHRVLGTRYRETRVHDYRLVLDLEDPAKVIARSEEAILSPREKYERIGDVNNVVFACGAIVEPDDKVKIYYGGADTCLCVATASMDALIEATLS